MSVDKNTVAKIAHLARIKVPDASLEPLVGELNNILDFVEQLNEVNTDNVAPMTSVVAATMVLRDDDITAGDCRDEVLANAPAAEHGFFAVPKVIE
ncbi:MAG: Asp-tRNA(Asn)/Glu-tRNA(Gln) amidotransferase GatCAB subunit C [Kordiimonas sp.]|nr:Asp-tRNA(Asn)/Glu-tRNA(Gln) amidotransferase GatCAB subunit C [Kordiimonas sp.]|tara:strand:- start:538 stop:825 length:288 start_codon:yes stop_codon:yes gene_type:complete